MSGSRDLPEELETRFRDMWGIALHIADRLDDEVSFEDFLEIERVKSMLTKFTYYYDSHDTERLVTLFHPECRLVNPRGTFRGVGAIRANYQHLMAQPIIRFHGATNVSAAIEPDGTAAWLFGYLASVGGGAGTWTGVTGSYAAHLLKVDGHWLFRNLRMSANVQTHDGRLTPIVTRAPKPDEDITVTDWLGPGWVR